MNSEYDFNVIELTYEGIPLTVVYEEDYGFGPEDYELIATSVRVRGIDIIGIITDEVLNEIEDSVIDELILRKNTKQR